MLEIHCGCMNFFINHPHNRQLILPVQGSRQTSTDDCA